MHIPRLLISALRGGAGKTLLSLGLARALSTSGMNVKPYKKGPDYIDAAWLARAAHCPCTNLDPFFLSPDALRSLFQHAWSTATPAPHMALLEGNRGLFDGRDVHGSCSSAELARVLQTPVLLSLDCTKMTRTAAAVVAGLAAFEPGMRLGGVVLNQVASSRHESIVRQSIEAYTDIPVLGALPRLKHNPLPERHMGLVMDIASNAPPRIANTGHDSALRADLGVATNTSPHAPSVLDTLAAFITENVDMPRVVTLAQSAPNMAAAAPFWPASSACTASSQQPRPRIGFVHDAALWFYYHENLEALERAGAELVPLSLLDAAPWPTLDGLYLGGGFPELFAEELSRSPRLGDLRGLATDGAPIYAECGGFMVLCRSVRVQGKDFALSGVLPAETIFESRPQGLGYVEATVENENPFLPVGLSFRGHEFHYSRCVTQAHTLLRLTGGCGMGNGRDGLRTGNVFAAYTHLFAPAVPHWAPNFVQAAAQYHAQQYKIN